MTKQALAGSFLFSTLLVLALAGCGGGGSSARVPAPKCVPIHDGTCAPDGAVATRAEALAEEYGNHTNYRNQWGLDAVNAGRAYGNLELLEGPGTKPGAGVTIGFIDTGIDRDHEAFAGKTVTERLLGGATEETGKDHSSHGTAVASVAAGVRSSASYAAHGVAWGANIAMFAIPLGSGGGKYVPVSLRTLAGADDYWATLFQRVLAWRAGNRRVDILNLSFGYSGIIDSYSGQQLRANFGDTIAALAQSGSTEKTILVWNAGNAHNDPCDPADLPQCVNGRVNAASVELFGGLAARIAELRGHTLVVVALRPGDDTNNISEGIADFSNRCGIARDYCIAAPGEFIRGAYFGPHPDPLAPPDTVIRDYATNLLGTSFSAPMVAGGLALMKQLFRDQLSNRELVARLLKTANNRGRYANRAIYGRGKMDLGAATSPVGVLSVPITEEEAGTNARLQSTGFQPGAAFGDGLTRSLASREIMALDHLGAPFWFRLGSFAPAAEGPSITAQLRGFLAPAPAWQSPMSGTRLAADRAGARHGTAPARLRVGFLDTPAYTGGGHLALARGAFTTALAGEEGLAAAAFTTRGPPTRAPATGASVMWRPAASPLGVQAGWMGEPEALLGSVGGGAFGSLAGDTAFVGMEGHAEAGVWRMSASAEFGAVHPKAKGGVISGISPLSTSAFALHAGTAPANWGAVRFSVSQPLRVERGRARLTVPAARTKAGAVVYRSVSADLAPSGRQIDVAGQWSRRLAKGELRLGGVWSHHPGHGKAADPEVTVLAGWRWAF